MADTSAGHLSVRVEGLHADDVPFLFERQPKRIGLSFVASAVFDVLIAMLIVIAGRHTSSPGEAPRYQRPDPQIVWLVEEGSGGGGGGGGNQMQEPPRQAQLPGRDRLTVPVTEPPAIDPARPAQEEQLPVAPLIMPAQPLAAAADIHPGILDAAAPSLSQGSGTEGGAGTGSGGGIGPGRGLGLDSGFVANIGGGPSRPGSGVTPPVEIYVPRPQYTADAMRARVQGKVWVECVVRTDGTCTNTRVARSLDSRFGLDQEAIRAAGLFRFRPGTRMGEPVPVLVTIELTFSLH